MYLIQLYYKILILLVFFAVQKTKLNVWYSIRVWKSYQSSKKPNHTELVHKVQHLIGNLNTKIIKTQNKCQKVLYR